MLFLVPARAGSKRLPGKNKRLFCGLPLWIWSAATANRVKRKCDHLHVSTDDEAIAAAAGVPLRPSNLAMDESPTQALIDWCFETFEADSICLLQPTSPTRSDSLVRRLIAHGGQVRSVTNGKPNGQCYVYRRGHDGWTDIETEQGHDIDTLDQFNEAEKAMKERFA